MQYLLIIPDLEELCPVMVVEVCVRAWAEDPVSGHLVEFLHWEGLEVGIILGLAVAPEHDYLPVSVSSELHLEMNTSLISNYTSVRPHYDITWKRSQLLQRTGGCTTGILGFILVDCRR